MILNIILELEDISSNGTKLRNKLTKKQVSVTFPFYRSVRAKSKYILTPFINVRLAMQLNKLFINQNFWYEKIGFRV